MKDDCGIPFWGKQKPLKHYFEHGVISFNVKEGTLHYEIKQITKFNNSTLFSGLVKDLEHLNKLTSIKSIQEINSILPQ